MERLLNLDYQLKLAELTEASSRTILSYFPKSVHVKQINDRCSQYKALKITIKAISKSDQGLEVEIIIFPNHAVSRDVCCNQAQNMLQRADCSNDLMNEMQLKPSGFLAYKLKIQMTCKTSFI